MKLPNSVKNLTSIIGASIALLSFLIIFFLLIISFIYDQGSSYLGIFIYIILPVFLIIGLILIPVGMIITRRKMRRLATDEVAQNWPVIDFNIKPVRNAALIFAFGTVLFLMMTAIGSYEAFHYTESVEFCGTLCHKVMEPEYVAFYNSSHERVKCVDCHVGTGADWYVKSKLSGLYQIYSVAFDKYPRPIPTPLHNLRPARETCEQCHWPEKFYDHKIKLKRSYLADDTSTEWDIKLQMKTSASLSARGLEEGIHWHINPDVQIEYRHNLNDRNDIPWVRYTNRKTGEEIIYTDPEMPIENLQLSELRVMDCIDCHNRPSHNYQVPQNFIDEAISAGKISKDLPDIKFLAMEVLREDYPTKDSAFSAIAFQVKDYFEMFYPEMLETHKSSLDEAIAAIQHGYSRNIFPEMKVKWSEYPNHLGHLETNGCYRCHNDRHVSQQKRVISRDCNLCHQILAQGRPGELQYSSSFESLEFEHPVDIGTVWKEKLCSDCHFQLY
jgi:hypothetical protein